MIKFHNITDFRVISKFAVDLNGDFRGFERLFQIAASKIIAINKKMFKFGIKVTNIAPIDAILMILVYLHIFLGNDLKSQKQSSGGVLQKRCS